VAGADAPEVALNDPSLAPTAEHWSQYVVVDTVKLRGVDGRMVTLQLPTGRGPLHLSVLEENCTDMKALDVRSMYLVLCCSAAPVLRCPPLLSPLVDPDRATAGVCIGVQVLGGVSQARHAKAVKKAWDREEQAMLSDPSAASFHRGPVAPTVASTVNMAPCLELLFNGEPYLADVRFAFVPRAVAAVAVRSRKCGGAPTLSTEDRELLRKPPVLLFVHWHAHVAVKDAGLAMPSAVTYLGPEYSILDASDVRHLGLLRRVHLVPQLGDISELVDLGGAQGPGPLGGAGRGRGHGRGRGGGAGAGSAGGPPGAASVAGRLPVVAVYDTKGVRQLVYRRMAVSSHPFMYIGYATMTVMRVALVLLFLLAARLC
jgi:hypothetical protein